MNREVIWNYLFALWKLIKLKYLIKREPASCLLLSMNEFYEISRDASMSYWGDLSISCSMYLMNEKYLIHSYCRFSQCAIIEHFTDIDNL